MSKATYDDVNLILKLYELRREDKMRAARNWFVANFKCKNMDDYGRLCPPGSDENAYMRQVISYWDMVASFITSGVLNEELFFQSGREMLLVWIRMEPILTDVRAAFGPNFLKHLETVAKAYGEHMDHATPGAYQSLKARVGG